jgi:hypothetical protein
MNDLDRPHYVYELHAADGSLLYVGCTSNIGNRLAQHIAARDWWPEVARVVSDTYPDGAAAFAEERRRIVECAPRHNVVFTDKQFAYIGQRKARVALAHAEGRDCGRRTCGPCIQTAHARGIACCEQTCRDHSECLACLGFKPFYSLLTPEQRRARSDWEPWWESYLEVRPTYAEIEAWYEAARTCPSDQVAAHIAGEKAATPQADRKALPQDFRSIVSRRAS